MKKQIRCSKMFVAGFAVLAVMASTVSFADDETAGTIIGGVIGAVVGNGFGHGNGKAVATIVGAGIGAALGNGIGQQLDERDRLEAENSRLRAMEYGGSTEWQGHDRSTRGRFVTQDVFRNDSGYDCRSYHSETWVNGRLYTHDGTSCRYPDGSWKEWNRTTEVSPGYVQNDEERVEREERFVSCRIYDGRFGNRYNGSGRDRLIAEQRARDNCTMDLPDFYCNGPVSCEVTVRRVVVEESPDYRPEPVRVYHEREYFPRR